MMPGVQRLAFSDMASGGLLYVYVESENYRGTTPLPGSGAIVGERGLVRISSRTVRAIERLGTTWDSQNKAAVLTEHGKVQARMLAAGRDVISVAA